MHLKHLNCECDIFETDCKISYNKNRNRKNKT